MGEQTQPRKSSPQEMPLIWSQLRKTKFSERAEFYPLLPSPCPRKLTHSVVSVWGAAVWRLTSKGAPAAGPTPRVVV